MEIHNQTLNDEVEALQMTLQDHEFSIEELKSENSFLVHLNVFPQELEEPKTIIRESSDE